MNIEWKKRFTKEMLEKCIKNKYKMNNAEKLFLEDIHRRIKHNITIPILKYKKLQEYAHRF